MITEPEPNVTFAMSWMEAARADKCADEGAVGMVDALRLRLGVGVVANAVGVQCSRVHFECISSASQVQTLAASAFFLSSPLHASHGS